MKHHSASDRAAVPQRPQPRPSSPAASAQPPRYDIAFADLPLARPAHATGTMVARTEQPVLPRVAPPDPHRAIVARACAACDDEARAIVQRSVAPDAPGPPSAPESVTRVLGAAGEPLARHQRAYFEPRFGASFDHVRIHTGAAAAQSARDIAARAYTVGPHIVFGTGQYAPDTPDGRKLMAHELAHVVQQAGHAPGVQRAALAVGAVDDPREREADDAAARVIAGGASGISLAASGSHVARAPDPAAASVGLVEISTASNQIRFHTPSGNHRYALEHRGLIAGEYTATVVSNETDSLRFTLHGHSGSFEFSWRIAPGQSNPAAMFRGQTSVPFRIHDQAFPPVSAPRAEQPRDPGAVYLTPEEAQRRCESNDLRVMTFPFRGTRFGAAPIMARRDGDAIVVHQPVYVLASRDFREQTRTLPADVFTGGVRLAPNQIVRVHVYEPRWYDLNITGSASWDSHREFCVTGEQMLEIADASTTATMINIGLTVIDAATLFVPVGKLASAVTQPLTRGARTVTAAAMLGTAEVAPTALTGAASRATVTVVEEQMATRVAGQTIVQSVSQTVVRGTEAGAAQQVGARAASASLPRVASGVAADVAGRGAVAAGVDVGAGAVRPGVAPPGPLPEARAGAVGARGGPPATAPGESAAGQGGQVPRSAVGQFFFGPSAAPTQAQLQAELNAVWARLGGRNAPTITSRALAADTAGHFESWTGAYGQIVVNLQAQTQGQLRNTVWHEAMHARIREIFPWMREVGSQHPTLRVMFRHVDEIVAYAYGAYGQFRGAAGVVERLTSLTQMMLSPWLAYGSANSVGEALPGVVRDLALLALYVRFLMRLSSQRQEAREAPAAPAGR